MMPALHAPAQAAWPAQLFSRDPGLFDGEALSFLACHRLDDGALCGAEITQAGSPRDVGETTGGWLLRAACQAAQGWRQDDRQAAGFCATVRLPSHCVRAGTLVGHVAAALHCARLPAQRLCVALAEADLAETGPDLPLLVAALRDLGAEVALDADAHTGAGLHALRRLPLTGVRLHPALVRRAPADRDAREALAQTIRLAHAVGAATVALGVESAVQREVLAALGCDAVQEARPGALSLGSVMRERASHDGAQGQSPIYQG